MFFNNLKRKISTGHIGKQDTFDPPPPPPPSEHVQKFIRFGRLTLPYIQEAGGVHMLPHSFTSSGRWPHLLDCNFQIFQIWGGKWLKCRQCSLFSDKGLATTGLRNNVWGGRRASQVNDTCCCWYKVAVILSFEVETLYLTAGIIIFDTLVPRAFQKYTTCMVFKAVQLFKKSATWFSENEGGGSKAVWNFSKNSSVLVRTCFPKFSYDV